MIAWLRNSSREAPSTGIVVAASTELKSGQNDKAAIASPVIVPSPRSQWMLPMSSARSWTA